MPPAPDSIPADQGPQPHRPCGICPNPAADIKSHIIPRCEQRRLIAGDDKLVTIDPSNPRLVSEHANLYWQRWLLCSACEKQCSILDAFWAKFSDERGSLLTHVTARTPWVVPNVDVETLVSFLISVLLRAHASTRPEFRDFTLGKAHQFAVSAFQSGDAHSAGFRLIAQLPKVDGISQELRAMPHMAPAGNAALLWFGVFRFFVCLPFTSWSPEMSRLMSRPKNSELLVVPKPLDEIPEYQRLMTTLLAHQPRKAPR